MMKENEVKIMAFMSVNSGGGGDFIPYVKYNAKAGRFYTKKDEPDAQEFEVQDMTAIFDMDNLQTGWFLFAAGQAPSKIMDPSLSEMSPSPGDGYKRGFQLNLFSDKNLLGAREFSSTAGSVIDAMNDLHTAWEAGKAANAGKVPVVKSTGVIPITNKHGTNYKPQFEIVSWADRPAGLPTPSSAPAAIASSPSSPPPPAAHTPPPTAVSDAVEF
jgi:hypothetical protein